MKMKNIIQLLTNPFERYSEMVLFSIGLAFTVLGTLLGFYFNARFDGILDMHLVRSSSLKEVSLDNFINIFCLSALLFGVAKFVNIKTRLIDILNTVLISRITIYLLVFLPTPSKEVLKLINTGKFTQVSNLDVFLLSTMGIIALLFLVWHMSILYKGFKVASNAKKVLPVVLFSIAIITAEILSKFLIIQFN